MGASKLSGGARRIGPALVCGGLLVSIVLGARSTSAQEAAPPDATAKPVSAKTAMTSVPAKTGLRKNRKNTKNTKKKRKPAAQAEAPAAPVKRRRVGVQPVYVVGDTNMRLINENAPKIVAFPQEEKAVEKAFAESRRDQLVDAERAARDTKSPDRWRTVLFSLRGLHDRNDPEACFWRVLSFYRLAEIDRARAVRDGCELPARDSGVLNAEDAKAAHIPAMGTVPREDVWSQPAAGASGEAKPEPKPMPPAPDDAPYTGPGPQRAP